MAERLESVVANALRIPESDVTDALEFNGIHQWDSLNHVALMLALEAAYDVSIPDDLMIELTSVRAIRAFIDGQTATRTNL
jgi:acyl carrier protein